MRKSYIYIFILITFIFVFGCTKSVKRHRTVPYQDWAYVEETKYVPEEHKEVIYPVVDASNVKTIHVRDFKDPIDSAFMGVGKSISRELADRLMKGQGWEYQTAENADCLISGKVLTMKGDFFAVYVSAKVHHRDWESTFAGKYHKVIQDIVDSFTPQTKTTTKMAEKVVTVKKPVTKYREEVYYEKKGDVGGTILLLLLLGLMAGSGGGE